MSRHFAETEAVESLHALGFDACAPFPGSQKSWSVRCLNCGHVQDVRLAALRHGSARCPYCAGTRLHEADAELLLRTYGFEPLVVYPGAKGKRWLSRCLTCGRESAPSLENLTTRGTGCTYCRGASVHPDDADAVVRKAGFEPVEPFPGAQKAWRCRCTRCGKVSEVRYSRIASTGSGCKYCAGYIDEDDAIAAMQALGLDPIAPYPGALKPWPSVCQTCGSQVSPTLNNVKRRGGACRYCAGQVRDPAEAAARMLAAGLQPLTDYSGANAPWPARCLTCGGDCSPRFASIRRGGGCARCSLEKQAQAQRTPSDVAEAYMIEVKGLVPLVPYAGNHRPWKCRCQRCGREVSPTFANAKAAAEACKYCAGHALDAQAVLQVMKAADAHPLEPYPGSGQPWHSRCAKCDRDIWPRYSTIAKGQGACVWCAGMRVEPSEASLVMREAGLEPLVSFPGSDKPWPCKCTVCGHDVSPTYGNVRAGTSSGCAYCAGNRVDPLAAVEWMDRAALEPLEPYPGNSKARWRCRCKKCGNDVTPSYGQIRSGNGGCGYCSTSGLRLGEPAFVYLLTHPEWNAHKVGIAQRGSGRLKDHAKRGWMPYRTLDFIRGDQAHAVEQAVLDWWRTELGFPPCLAEVDGWTETIDADAISLDAVWARIEGLASPNPDQTST